MKHDSQDILCSSPKNVLQPGMYFTPTEPFSLDPPQLRCSRATRDLVAAILDRAGVTRGRWFFNGITSPEGAMGEIRSSFVRDGPDVAPHGQELVGTL